MRKYQARFGGGPTEKDQQWYLAGGLPDTTEGRKAALDPRLVAPSAPADPQGKISQIVRNLVRFYHESQDTLGVQAVFIDTNCPRSETA